MSNLAEPFYKEGDRQQASDEISLAELLHHLIAHWKTVAGAIIAALAIALVYLVTTTPTYSTDLSYGHEVGGLEMLNMVPGINYDEDQVINELSLYLASYENFKSYLGESGNSYESLAVFADRQLSDEDRKAYQRRFFRDGITISQPKQQGDLLHTLELSYSREISGPSFVNGYFQWTLASYKNELIARADRIVADTIKHNQSEMAASEEAYATEIRNQVTRLREADEIRLSELHDRLEAERQAVLASREERIRALREAGQVAARLGIEKPTTPYELGRHETSRDVIYAEINSQGKIPLYFMGTEALSAEREIIEGNLRDSVKTAEIRSIEKEISQIQQNRTIEALLNRESHAPFNSRYAELEKQNTLLRSYQLTPDDIQVAKVAHWAYQPDAPDSPRAALTLMLALILGGMFGLIIVALYALWKQARAIRTSRSLT